MRALVQPLRVSGLTQTGGNRKKKKRIQSCRLHVDRVELNFREKYENVLFSDDGVWVRPALSVMFFQITGSLLDHVFGHSVTSRGFRGITGTWSRSSIGWSSSGTWGKLHSVPRIEGFWSLFAFRGKRYQCIITMNVWGSPHVRPESVHY